MSQNSSCIFISYHTTPTTPPQHKRYNFVLDKCYFRLFRIGIAPTELTLQRCMDRWNNSLSRTHHCYIPILHPSPPHIELKHPEFTSSYNPNFLLWNRNKFLCNQIDSFTSDLSGKYHRFLLNAAALRSAHMFKPYGSSVYNFLLS